MTTAPAFTACGANSSERLAPALKIAIWTSWKDLGATASTVINLPLKRSFLPAERGEASSLSRPTGKFRRSSVWSTSTPTAPVAPRIAIFFMLFIKGAAIYANPCLNSSS